MTAIEILGLGLSLCAFVLFLLWCFLKRNIIGSIAALLFGVFWGYVGLIFLGARIFENPGLFGTFIMGMLSLFSIFVSFGVIMEAYAIFKENINKR
jgi:hypothetical protein